MHLLNRDLPRVALVIDVAIAALAAIGITILVGGETHALVWVPLLTGALTFALVAATSRKTDAVAPREVGGLRDPATGLATEALAAEVLAREFAAAQRGRLVTLVLMRLDGMSGYRAAHGDAAAERLVRAAGRAIARDRRRMDLAALHGPEPGTFLALLSGSDAEGAKVYAARVRKDLMDLKGVAPPEGVRFGIAAVEPTMGSAEELVRKATWALERSAGRGVRMTVVGGRVKGG